jgi:hydrogenase 3 maturation protease
MNLPIKTILQNKLKGATCTVVLGMGSKLRGDDGAGVVVAEKILQQSTRPNLHVIIGETAPENFTGEIKRLQPSHLILVDSAQMNLPPGTVQLIEKDQIGGISFSTHSLPVKVMLDYLLDNFKFEVIIIGIQPKTCHFGEPLSKKIATAVTKLSDTLANLAP